MVAAANLAAAGRMVRVVLLGAAGEVHGDAAEALRAVQGAKGLELREIGDESQLREALQDAELVLDAIVGTGFKPPLRGLAAQTRNLLNGPLQPQPKIVAVDLPSGWDADSVQQTGGQGEAAPMRADAVVTFAAPKLAHVFGQLTAGVFDPVVIAPIGTPENAIESSTGLHWAGAAKRIAEVPRGVDGNKGKFGHVLLLGGAWGKAGAPSMASLAAMRTGAGLVTAAVPQAILPIVAQVAPELMLTGLEPTHEGTAQEAARSGLSLKLLEPEAMTKFLKGITVVGLGPGLGQDGSTPEFVRTFVERVTLPMVIDADALNALDGRTALLHQAVASAKAQAKPRTIVLTPHPGEMARLTGLSVKEVEADRIGLARRFATEHGVTLVLKGWRTLIAHPDGRIAVNTTGNPSMAKGGSGDILTGIVAAMLAQYGVDVHGREKSGQLEPASVARAVEAAVFLHGLAGDFACRAQDEHTVLATDTVDHLWEAFRCRVTDAEGFTWIAGTAAAPNPSVGGETSRS